MWPAEIKAVIDRARVDAVTDGPLVSVVITTRNAQKHLARAIDSLKAQDYRSIEVILHDCVSADRTLEIARNCGVDHVTLSQIRVHLTVLSVPPVRQTET